MTVRPHHSIDELHRLYRSEIGARMARRLQTIWLARQGSTCREIMAVTGASRRAVQQWVAKYNACGLDGLVDRPRCGAPTKLSPAIEQEIRDRIEAGPTDTDAVSVFAAPAIREMIHREYGVLYSLTGLHDWLRRMGFSYQAPRPRHENSDPQAQEAFKKSFPSGWKPSPPPIQTSK